MSYDTRLSGYLRRAITWKVIKKGYKAVSGISSVDAMGMTELDLSEHPLLKEEETGPSILLYLIPVVVLVLVVVGVGLFLRTRKKGEGPKERAKQVAEEVIDDEG